MSETIIRHREGERGEYSRKVFPLFAQKMSRKTCWGAKGSYHYPEVFVRSMSLTLKSGAESEYRSYDRSRWTRRSIKNADDMDIDQEKNNGDGPGL